MSENKYRRWYDDDPTLSLAISLLKSAPEETRRLCVELALEKISECGLEVKLGVVDNIKYQLKRWYDKDERLYKVLEYLKNSPINIRRKIARDIIDYLHAIIK